MLNTENIKTAIAEVELKIAHHEGLAHKAEEVQTNILKTQGTEDASKWSDEAYKAWNKAWAEQQTHEKQADALDDIRYHLQGILEKLAEYEEASR